MRRFRERAVRVKVSRRELPTADPPPVTQALSGPSDSLAKVVVVPESGIIAIERVGGYFIPSHDGALSSRENDSYLRLFALDGDGDPLHLCDGALAPSSDSQDSLDSNESWKRSLKWNIAYRFGKARTMVMSGIATVRGFIAPFSGLAALGSDVIASCEDNGTISTWRASSGERLETILAHGNTHVTAMAPVGENVFVVGTSWGELIFLAHIGGLSLTEVAFVETAHPVLFSYRGPYGSEINDIAVRGDLIVTASCDMTAAVGRWNAATYERLAVLREQEEGFKLNVRGLFANFLSNVTCAAISERFIATGAMDATIRLFENREGFSLVRVLVGIHTDPVTHVSLIGDDLLMSASWDGTVAFTSLADGRWQPVARLDAGIGMNSVAITPDGRLACAGKFGKAAVLSPPALLSDVIKEHAALVLFPSISPSSSNREPLQAALVEVGAGRRSAGDACRELITKENCSRSVEEWWCAHRLLMTAVGREEISGELCFEGELFYWFLNLYTPSRHLELGPEDWEIVKRCACEAREAGVISEPEAVLAAVLGGQDLSREVAKLQTAGQSMLYLLAHILMQQAEVDLDLQELGKELDRVDRVQKMNSLLTAVFSFAPLGGAAAANAISSVAEALPLLESMLGTGVGIQSAFTPMLLDKFLFSANSLLSIEGWARVAPENRVVLQDASEGLGMKWHVFHNMVRDAVARRDAKTDEADAGAANGSGQDRFVSVENVSDNMEDARSMHQKSDQSVALVCDSGGTGVVAADSGSISMSELKAGEGSASSVTGIGSAVSVTTGTDNGDSFDLEELKAAASDSKVVESMNIDALSRTVAAVMINFEEDSRLHLPVLAKCLRKVFGDHSIGGDTIADGLSRFPGDFLRTILDALGQDDLFTNLGVVANVSFSRRLERFIQALQAT